MSNTIAPPPINTIKALVGSNRLEPRPRTEEFNRSLRAEIRDPTWMLARQWQMKEFQAEDRGAPAFAEIKMDTAPLTHLQRQDGPARLYAGQPLPPAVLADSAPTILPEIPLDEALSFAGAVPLEASVEAQPLIITPGLRLEMGEAWVKLLRKSGLERFVPDFRRGFPLSPRQPEAPDYDLEYALDQSSPEIHSLLQSSGTRAVDGFKIYNDLLTRFRSVLEVTRVQEEEVATFAALKTAGQQFVECFSRLYFSQFNNAADFEPNVPTAWSIPDLSYQFAVGIPTAGLQAEVLTATDYSAQGLRWYSLDKKAAASASAFPNQPARIQHTTTRFTPTVMRFPGAPNARWWEFEDRKVDFGALTADASDIGRMLLQDFMFLYQKDWFSFPYSVPVGSLSTVQQLRVRDVFGSTYEIYAAGASELMERNSATKIDNDEGRWNLFGLSERGLRRPARPQIFVPPAALSTMTGKPVEQLLLRREEATNLVWGIEQTIPDGFGKGMDGTAAALQVGNYLKSRAQPVTNWSDAKYAYTLVSGVTENWIPFLPRPNEEGLYELEQGEMLRSVPGLSLRTDDQTVKPRSSLLQLGSPREAYRIHERQVPPTGVRIESAFRRTRWFDGRIALWFARTRTSGYSSNNGSSGLAFDTLSPVSAPPIPAAPVAWYKADTGVSYDAAGNLTQWQDVSGNGLHLAPKDAGSISAMSPDEINGKTMIRARALTSSRNCGITDDQGRTIYVVGKAITAPVSPDYELGTAFVSWGSLNTSTLFECATSNSELLIHAYGSGESNVGHLAPQPVTTPALFAWRYDGEGNSYCDFNDQRGTAGGPATLNTSDSPLTLAYGLFYGASQADFFEVLVYNRFLTLEEDRQVREYLGSRANLPV
jgi:hypothetical protein